MKRNGAYIFQSVNFVRKTNNLKSMSIESEQVLFKLFISELKEMYWSEKMMVKALAKIIKNTTDLYLILLLNLNLEITKNQITRLEYIFEALKVKFETKICEKLKVMLVEINSYIKHYEKGNFKDEIMMLNFQKTAQFRIDSYDSVCEYAKSIGEFVVADFLLESLNEKIKLDLKLTEMSDSNVNSNIQEYFQCT